MHVFYTDQFVLPLPEGHRFPMAKYALLRERVAAMLPHDQMHIPPAATDVQILRAHDTDYLRRVQAGELTDKEIRRIGFPWTPQMVERSRRSSGATIEAAYAALRQDQGGIAVNLAGGTHHAFRDHGGGYCVFNDAAIAAREIQAAGLARQIAIIDCDVHQGDGTASILAGEPSVFTFSIHGENNYPFHKETSDLDIGLPDGTGDSDYLDVLQNGLNQVLTRITPDLVIYLAGADPFEGDKLGKLKLSKAGLLARDRLVLSTFAARRVPMAIAMAGGYARDVHDTADIHYGTVCTALEFARMW